jgi:hypothetical protein
VIVFFWYFLIDFREREGREREGRERERKKR